MKRDGVVYFQSKGFPEFRFLSNFHLSPIRDGLATYHSVEHFYQTAKARDEKDWDFLYAARTPAESRKRGQLVKLPDGWETLKLEVMERATREKFKQSNELRQMLLATEGFELVEYAPWGDTFWGVGRDYEGQNHLGKILMRIREECKT